MKQKFFLPLLVLILFAIGGCQEKKSSSSSPSTDPSTATCNTGTNYYTMPGCPGYVTQTSGGTSGGVGSCTGQAHWTTPGCAGFCQYNPTHTSCVGGGSSSGGSSGGVNCAQNPFSYSCYCQSFPFAYGCSQQAASVDYDWGKKYPGTSSSVTAKVTCSTSNTSGKHPTRKGTVTINSGTWYNPSSSIASNYSNTTTMLKNVTDAKNFFLTDSLLKIRLKPLPEPESAGTSPEDSCFGRSGTHSYLPGYTKLRYRVKLVGTKSDNSTEEQYLGEFTTTVNTCGTTIDLSSYASYYTNGVYVIVYDVRSNKGDPAPSNYWQNGFISSSSFQGPAVQRSSECWSMEIEVSADGTQTF